MLLRHPSPSICPKSLLPRGEQLLKPSRKETFGQCLSLAPAISIPLGHIQSILVRRDKGPMYTRGEAKIIPLDPIATITLVTLTVPSLKVGLSPSYHLEGQLGAGFYSTCLTTPFEAFLSPGQSRPLRAVIFPPSWKRKILLAAEVQAQLALITFG